MITLDSELLDILRSHASRYPGLQPVDVIKLIYQNEFGGEHMLPSHSEFLLRLKAETAGLAPDSSLPETENIGNGRVRLMLASPGILTADPEIITRAFALSVQGRRGSRDAFLEKAETASELAGSGVFAFGNPDFRAELERFIASGFEPVSHSDIFRRRYRPAYRVVDEKYARAITGN